MEAPAGVLVVAVAPAPVGGDSASAAAEGGKAGLKCSSSWWPFVKAGTGIGCGNGINDGIQSSFFLGAAVPANTHKTFLLIQFLL